LTLDSVAGTGGCATACSAAEYTQVAEFSYRGPFDPTGLWYHNRHDSTVVVQGDGAARCEHKVTLRHVFIGWIWVRGCG
jgi:hypothetical protein